MSTGCKSSHNGFLDVSRSNGGLRISGWMANCHVWRFSPPACQWQPSIIGLAVQCWRADLCEQSATRLMTDDRCINGNIHSEKLTDSKLGQKHVTKIKPITMLNVGKGTKVCEDSNLLIKNASLLYNISSVINTASFPTTSVSSNDSKLYIDEDKNQQCIRCWKDYLNRRGRENCPDVRLED